MKQNPIDQSLDRLKLALKTALEASGNTVDPVAVIKKIDELARAIPSGNIESKSAKTNSLNLDEIISKNIVVTNDLTVSGILRANVDINYADLTKKIPQRSLSGDLISGGVIRGFSSTGIKDLSSGAVKLTVKDDAVYTDVLNVGRVDGDLNVSGTVRSGSLDVAGTIKAQRIEVKEIRSDLRVERTSSLEFKHTADNSINGKGMIWTGSGPTKQFVLKSDNSIFSSESLDLQRERSYMIDNTVVLSQQELGPTVAKSRLREVGVLKGLTVSGDTNLGNCFKVDSTAERVVIGEGVANGKLSLFSNGVELKLDVKNNQAVFGAHSYHDLTLVTDDVARITVQNNGNISLGNKNAAPIQVTVQGKLSVGVNTPDTSVDLHVAGAVKFNNKLQTSGVKPPDTGVFNTGDIVWNSEPRTGQPVAWVCTRGGTPGTWRPFALVE